MKIINLFILIIVLLFLISCGSGGGGSHSAVFSSRQAHAQSAAQLNIQVIGDWNQGIRLIEVDNRFMCVESDNGDLQCFGQY